ncbi:hypothetical protein [Stenotrophomonas sp. NPDC077659]|uniref:hypothetical protein n=1 Tax=Stenotrophomonas sp. NPDC077659 TaxID=3390694 RepID=UPI003D0698ED
MAWIYWNAESGVALQSRAHARLTLIESLRALKAQGHVIDVVGSDVNSNDGSSQIRDDRMAAELRRLYRRLPEGTRMLVLTGNVHATLQRPAGALPEMQAQPMASLLRDLDIYSVRLEAQRGHFWACLDRCKALPIRDQPARAPHVDTDSGRQYDLWLWMPALSVGTLVDP